MSLSGIDKGYCRAVFLDSGLKIAGMTIPPGTRVVTKIPPKFSVTAPEFFQAAVTCNCIPGVRLQESAISVSKLISSGRFLEVLSVSKRKARPLAQVTICPPCVIALGQSPS